MVQLSAPQIVQLGQQAGFSGDALARMVAIAKRESGWNSDAYNGNENTGDNSVGLMQINMIGDLGVNRMNEINRLFGANLASVDQAKEWLKDPANNLKYANYISGGGQDWSPWTTNTGIETGTDLPAARQLVEQYGGGGTMPSGGGVVGPEINQQLDFLRQTAQDLQTKFMNGDPNVVLQDVLDAIGAYHDLADYQLTLSDQSDSKAQQAFTNSLALGDLEGKNADREYQRYLDKRNMARDAAQTEIGQAGQRNSDNAALTESFAQNHGQGPVPDTRTYFAPGYKEALDMYEKKFGVGAEPGLSAPSGIAAPSFGGGQASGGQAAVAPAPPPTPGNALLGPTHPPEDLSLRPDSDFADGDPNSAVNPTPAPYDPGNPWAVNNNMPATGVPEPFQVHTGKSASWWNKIRGLGGLLRFAGGTASAPGGMAMVGEKGPETMVDPRTGQVVPIGTEGPQVMNVPQGAAVLPSDVPPDEAYAYAQIQKGINTPQADPRQQSMQGQAERAQDPDLQAKVQAALNKAIASQDAMNPPPTPVLIGNWAKHGDPWANWRPLSGIGPDGQPLQPPAAQKGAA